MALLLKNNSADTFSYLSGQIVVEPNSTLDVDSVYWFNLVTDSTFMNDVKLNNLVLNDGVKDYSYPISEDFMKVLTRDRNTSTRDTDGALIVRNKAAKKGWTFCSLPLEFQTARLSDTLFAQDSNGVNRSFITMKAYNAQGAEVTTPGTLNANYSTIVKTVIDFEPPYDYEVIGGDLRTLSAISVDIRLWIIAAPDIPAPNGSKEMCGGINLRYLGTNNVFSVDGRVSKYATYNAALHTNKIRMIFKYPAGQNENIQIVVQLYKQ